MSENKQAKPQDIASKRESDLVSSCENSPLTGKTVFFLGSSVTYGEASGGYSFADHIAAQTHCTMIKEAVSGTTLADNGESSYLRRLKKWDESTPVDLFVCQLSTNDAWQNQPLHEVASAIEAIISYAAETWGCPVVFYTSPRYNSERYGAMVSLLREIAEKRSVTVIDLWNDMDFNNISAEQRALYMADEIHPTLAGYKEWWSGKICHALERVVSDQFS